jgi:DNA-binding transcriptional LysR family regulator
MESVMDTLQAMRLVLAIAEQGSLTAAAQKLGTSLPTVVRVLAATEQHLGVRLFERTTRQVRITEEGRRYAESARAVLREIETVEDVFRDKDREPSGELVISAPVLFGQYHVMPCLSSFMKQFPKVTVTLILLDRVTDLIEEGIDIAVRIAPIVTPDLVVTPLGQVRRYLVASPELLASLPPIEQPADISDVPFIQHSALVLGAQVVLEERNKPMVIKMNNVRMKTNSAAGTIAACIDGLGLGMVLSYQVRDAIADDRLRVVLRDFLPPPVPVSLVYMPSRRNSVRSQAFIKWAREAISQRLSVQLG